MALRKIRKLDNDSFGVTLAKGDLQVEGIVDLEGELTGEHRVHIRHVDEGEWRLELVDVIEA